MWIGIVFALLLCLATAVCYAEMAKLYPGTGSSYYFAEQSFLNHETAWKYARLSKFIVGWGSHLYYWIYPGVMVGGHGRDLRISGRHALAEFHERVQSRPDVHDAGRDRLLLCRRLHRHPRRNGSTAVNIAINVIQISALVVFSVMALGYRINHPAGSRGLSVRFQLGRRLHLRVRDREADRQRRRPPT